MRCSLFAICSFSLCAGTLVAGNPATPLEPLTVSVQAEAVKTIDPIYRAYVTVGENKFAFLIPEKFRAGGDPAQGKLQLTSFNGSTVITLSFIGAASGESVPAGRDHYRQLLSENFPDAKIVSEFKRPVLGRDGLGFDLNWKSAAGFGEKTRAVYIATSAGVLAVTITSDAKNFPSTQADLNHVLASLVAGTNGKINVRHIASVG